MQSFVKQTGKISYSLSTAIVHSVTKAATAPTAAKTGTNTAPTTPIVKGNTIIVLPFCL